MGNIAALTLVTVLGTGTQNIGIFDISVVGLDPQLQKTAIDALATAVAGQPGFAVVSRTELEAMLSAEKMKDVLGCDDISCLSEIGMAAGVQRIISGSVSKVDAAITVSLQLVNVQYAQVENRVSLTWEGSLAQLSNVLGAAAERLVLVGDARARGSINVTGIPPEAGVTVDGQARGAGPTVVDGLDVGVYSLAIDTPGYEPYRTQFVIRAGAVEAHAATLVQLPESPFYSKWWFWTATAVVVGGTVAALSMGGNDGGSGPGTGDILVVAPVPEIQP